jgi:dihydroxyacetone kinase-like protein
VAIDRERVLAWIERFAAEIDAHRQELVQLDSAIGDGDHGTNMQRGMQRALERVRAGEQADPGAVLKDVAGALVSSVGGAAGPLYGTLFLQLGTALAGKPEVGLADWAAAWRRALEAVQRLGRAQPGEKTMIDALAPAVAALEQAADLDAALLAAARAAQQGMLATIPLIARKGRASYLGERSEGHQDPGATSSYYLFESAAATLSD